MKFIRENSVVCVVDLQAKIFPHMYAADDLLKRCVQFLQGAVALDLPVLITEQYTKGLGPTMHEFQEVLVEKYKPIEKIHFSCFKNQEFKDKLEQTGKKDVFLIGIESHVCVLQTALDLAEAGYNPILVVDCVSSRNPMDKKYALKRLKQNGVELTTMESALFELLVSADAAEFRTISKIVK